MNIYELPEYKSLFRAHSTIEDYPHDFCIKDDNNLLEQNYPILSIHKSNVLNTTYSVKMGLVRWHGINRSQQEEIREVAKSDFIYLYIDNSIKNISNKPFRQLFPMMPALYKAGNDISKFTDAFKHGCNFDIYVLSHDN